MSLGKHKTLLGLFVMTGGLAACEFRAGTDARPAASPPAAAPPPATAAPMATLTPPTTLPPSIRTQRLRRPAGIVNPVTPGSATPPGTVTPPAPGTVTPPAPGTVTPPAPGTVTPPVPPVPPTAPGVMTAANVFGSATSTGSFMGALYFIPEGTTRFPDVSKLPVMANFVAGELNIASRSFEEGWPGIGDGKRTTNFAVRYEAPLAVTVDAIFEFRIVSDDGALFYIDDTLLVDNDGVHDATEKKGLAHLIPGSHFMRIDYFQGATKNVALQVFVTQKGGKEKLLGATL